jgi:DNA-directed RNA polymerase III subunit RPC1
MTVTNSDKDPDDPLASNSKALVTKSSAPQKISHLQFGLLSKDEIQRIAEFQVTSRELFSMPNRTPAVGGCLDPRLGVSDKYSTCATCKEKLNNCAGHYGYIRLALPVFHIGYIKHTLNILQCICKTCSRILLPETERMVFQKRMRRASDSLTKAAIFKKVLEKCKKNKICPYCHQPNGTVKKITGVSTLKIIHEKYKGKSMEGEVDQLMEQLQTAISINKDIQNSIPHVYENLLPTDALKLFENLIDEDCEILWIDPLIGRPENLILQYLIVPPVPIRPSVAMDSGGGSNEDDLTVKLQEILDVNVALELAMSRGPHTKTIMEEWDFLQVQVAQYINGEMPGLQRPIGAKPIRGFCQRLKGKQGRFRGNLSGKRVDFSARTVISPDPNLQIDQVGVPVHVAKIMTYPEKVSRYNIEKLRVRVRNGPEIHPGANQIRMVGDGGFVKSLQFGDRDKAAKMLQIGDVVERHMEDGDIVLFNRQPSLHKMSIMSHRVKVMQWKTFRFNIQVCAPYNADFDGDEMNMHLPQTEEARAEATLLMGVHNNLVTGRNGEPLIAASQDFLSASYMLTQKDVFYSREAFCSLVSYFGNADEEINIPSPAILKPVPLWTGKQVFSSMINPNRNSRTFVNFEMKEKNYSNELKLKHFCPNDGWVAFRNGELISGNIAKKTIGDGSKTGLLYILLRDYGSQFAANAMDRFSRLCSRFMGHHKGFSIGVSDVTPSEYMQDQKRKLLSAGYDKADEHIRNYDAGTLELRPGCNLLQSLEEMLNGVLGKLRESAGQEAMKALEWSNAPRIMAECGSKGSPLNISQMMACVGQQAVGGNRIENGFVNRTLPHFEYHSLTPPAKGFVANSFYTGLSPTEFFFHTMGGREGLVDTAVKTAETGYMARRLMKALEDLSLQYDSTVRNSENTVVQFLYGDDNLNPELMENNDRPVDFDRLRMNAIQRNPCRDEDSLMGTAMMDHVEKWLSSERFQTLLPTGAKFHEEVRSFFISLINAQENILTDVTDDTTQDMKDQRIWNSCRLSKSQLDDVMDNGLRKYENAHVEPGEAIGPVGAQSISEPGTQMTLKTFHFAGVSSMNVTLGVPRLKEIINASKNISTPIITAHLVQDDNKIGARVVKAVIEKTTLGQVSRYIREVYASSTCYISVDLDMQAIDQLKLSIDVHSVRRAILKGCIGQTRPAILRSLKDCHVKVKKGCKSRLRVYVPEYSGTKSGSLSVYFAMQALKDALPEVIVQGIPSVNRAVINAEEKNGRSSYHLLVEGYGLAEVMGAPGIDGRRTTTNHVIEVEQTLGVEAARAQISSEISYIMNAYGIGIDSRHLLLLSDVMTFKGEVLGITRFGVSKMRESVLMLASFEKTTDHLFDAAAHGKQDAIIGVSECIIMGIPIPLGTGLFKLLKKANAPLQKSVADETRPLLLGFDSIQR